MKNKINLTGVILCAGKGTRIKKMPFSQPKTLLEILGLPIIYYQLRYLKNIGVIYKKDNKYILFLACENIEVCTVLEENIVVNSLILNRQMDNTPFTPRFLEVLGSLEICTGGNSNGHIYIKDFVDDARVQKISDQFTWSIADDINTDIGYIIRVIN